MDLWGLAGQLDSPRLAVQRPFERIPASDAASEGFSATISTLFMAPTILESYNGMANIIDDFSAAIDDCPLDLFSRMDWLAGELRLAGFVSGSSIPFRSAQFSHFGRNVFVICPDNPI